MNYLNFIITKIIYIRWHLTGEEIKDYLEFSYGNWFNQMSDSSDDLLKFKHNDDGTIKYSSRYKHRQNWKRYSTTFLLLLELITRSTSRNRHGERVEITTLSNGTIFDLDKTYTVAINSYRGSGGGGHLTRGAGYSSRRTC